MSRKKDYGYPYNIKDITMTIVKRAEDRAKKSIGIRHQIFTGYHRLDDIIGGLII